MLMDKGHSLHGAGHEACICESPPERLRLTPEPRDPAPSCQQSHLPIKYMINYDKSFLQMGGSMLGLQLA